LRWQTTQRAVTQEGADAVDLEEDSETGEEETGVTAGHEETEEEAREGAAVEDEEGAAGVMETRVSGCPARNWAAW
jgi:hypothetical protein